MREVMFCVTPGPIPLPEGLLGVLSGPSWAVLGRLGGPLGEKEEDEEQEEDQGFFVGQEGEGN